MEAAVDDLPMPRTVMRPVPAELVCRCGITFEPPSWHDPDNDEPLCVVCDKTNDEYARLLNRRLRETGESRLIPLRNA